MSNVGIYTWLTGPVIENNVVMSECLSTQLFICGKKWIRLLICFQQMMKF